MKKILFIILILSATVQAADTELQDLAALVDIIGTDVLYVVDDPAGVPASRKITALDLFDMIDTFAELNAITADLTLVSEEGTPTLDALWTFDLGLTITTGDPLTFGVNRIDNGADLLDGEMIGADTIDDDSIDWALCTFADFDFETAWRMWHSNAAGDVTEIILGADGTFLESNGAAANPAFRALADGDVPDTITINLATLATTVTLGDDDITNDNQDIVFTTDAAGPVNLEADIGDFHYNPSTGTVTATEFVGGGSGLTLASTDLSDTAALLYETELDDFAELDTQIADKALINLEDGGTFTGNVIANANLSVGNAGTTAGVLTLLEDDDDGAHFASFMVPALVASTVYTLPANDGDNLEVLQTNGAGTLDWVAAGTGNMNTATYDSTVSGGVDQITAVDSTYASDYVVLTGTAVGTDAPKTDGALIYDATSGTLGATEFVGGGVGLTGVTSSVIYNLMGDPTAAGSITFQDTETASYVTEQNTADSFFTIDNTVADVGNQVYLLDLDYSVDDNQAFADYFKCQDASGVVFTIQQDGDTATAGDLDLSNRTSTVQTGAIGRINLDCTLQPAGGLVGTTILNGIDSVAIWDSDQDGETQDGFITAGLFQSKSLDLGATGNIHSLRGLVGQIFHYGTGTVGQQIGVFSRVLNDDTFSENGDVTAAYNFYAESYTDKGTGTVAARYGFYTEDTTGGGNLTSQYGAYIADMTGATNDYGIAIAGADTYALWVSSAVDTTDAANGITFGSSGDTNLYRSAANTLKTDDTLATAGITGTGNSDFGGGDLELPQASPAVPDADGEIEVDFTDGKVVIQHGAAHAELAGATDIVMGTLIKSWSSTIYEPDGINDVMTVKAINSIEFPHGVVITAIYLGVSENSNYTLTIQNFDDFDTINGVNPTIDAVAYVADATGEIIDTVPTYDTIAAGQIIMMSIPATDVDWIHFEIYYYEPAS